MKCEKCGVHEASFHYGVQINGQGHEIHLCPGCAGDIGFGVPGVSEAWPFLGAAVKSGRTKAAGSPQAAQCPVCGRTPPQIVQSGRVGCSSCYEHFGGLLDGYLKRLYGGARHQGKFPRSAGEATRARRHREELNARLKEAVSREDYEQAAVLRDLIKAGGEAE